MRSNLVDVLPCVYNVSFLTQPLILFVFSQRSNATAAMKSITGSLFRVKYKPVQRQIQGQTVCFRGLNSPFMLTRVTDKTEAWYLNSSLRVQWKMVAGLNFYLRRFLPLTCVQHSFSPIHAAMHLHSFWISFFNTICKETHQKLLKLDIHMTSWCGHLSKDFSRRPICMNKLLWFLEEIDYSICTLQHHSFSSNTTGPPDRACAQNHFTVLW